MIDSLKERLHLSKEDSHPEQIDAFAEEVLNFLASKKFVVPTKKAPSYKPPLDLTDQQAEIFRLLLSSALGKAKFSVWNILDRRRILEKTYETTDRPIDQPNAPAHTIAMLHLFWDKDRQQPWRFYVDGEVKPSEVPPVHFMISQGPIKTQTQVEELWKDSFVTKGRTKIVLHRISDDLIRRSVLTMYEEDKALRIYDYELIGPMNQRHFIYGCNNAQPGAERQFGADTIVDGVDNYLQVYGRTKRPI